MARHESCWLSPPDTPQFLVIKRRSWHNLVTELAHNSQSASGHHNNSAIVPSRGLPFHSCFKSSGDIPASDAFSADLVRNADSRAGGRFILNGMASHPTLNSKRSPNMTPTGHRCPKPKDLEEILTQVRDNGYTLKGSQSGDILTTDDGDGSSFMRSTQSQHVVAGKSEKGSEKLDHGNVQWNRSVVGGSLQTSAISRSQTTEPIVNIPSSSDGKFFKMQAKTVRHSSRTLTTKIAQEKKIITSGSTSDFPIPQPSGPNTLGFSSKLDAKSPTDEVLKPKWTSLLGGGSGGPNSSTSVLSKSSSETSSSVQRSSSSTSMITSLTGTPFHQKHHYTKSSNLQESSTSSSSTLLASSGGLRPTADINGGPNLDLDDEIAKVLADVEATFKSMIDDHRAYFMESFPALRKMRHGPNGLANFLNRSRGGGDFSSMFSDENSYLLSPNRCIRPSSGSGSIGTHVVQWNSTVEVTPGQDPKIYSTRAFMEYHGPKEGYKVKVEPVALNDLSNGEASEDEDVEEEDATSHMSTVSEVPDDKSALVLYRPGGPPKLQIVPKQKEKLEKAWCAAKELVETERKYVEKLYLLDQLFRTRVEEENATSKSIPKDKMSALFSNLSSLYTFHNNYFLPELEDRLREWHQSEKLCDVIRRKAPYLKMYSEYANNYKKACKTFMELYTKNKKFASIVDEIQTRPECENLPLSTHLICPVQRIMRYNLTMQEYLKNLPSNHQDREDTEKSIELVADAANHANEIMRKLDKYKYVMEVQEEIGHQVPLVTASRELVKQGPVFRISYRTQEHHPRYLYLFNDLLLVCSDRTIALPIQPKSKKLRSLLNLDGMKVFEGDNLETENTFYIKTPEKTLELYTKDPQEKQEWQEALWNTLQEYTKCMKSFRKPEENEATDDHVEKVSCKNLYPERCMKCEAVFNAFRKPAVCTPCGRVLCKKCRSDKMLLPGDNSKVPIKVCKECYDVSEVGSAKSKRSSISDVVFRTLGRGKRSRPLSSYTLNSHDPDASPSPAQRTKSVLTVKPKEGAIYSGYLNLKTGRLKQWTRRYFAIHEDYVLYSFRSDEDVGAITSLPITGCAVSPPDPKSDAHIVGKEERVFKLTSPCLRSYFLQADTEDELAMWITVLELTANAEVPSESSSMQSSEPETPNVEVIAEYPDNDKEAEK